MFQRRATTSSSFGSSVPAKSIGSSGSSSTIKHGPQPTLRRRVRRRRYNSWWDIPDPQGLWVLAGLTVLVTAAVLWLGWQIYTAVILGGGFGTIEYRWGRGSPHHHHHRHHTAGKSASADDDDEEYEVLPWNPIYHIPEAMDIMGDRSDSYATLRQEMDRILPPDSSRSLQRVADLTERYPSMGTMPQGPHHSDSVREPYDIYNCPENPPQGYPFEWKLVDEVLSHWPVTEIENVPRNIHQGLCIFDYTKDYDKALRYRKAELPFVVINDPNVARTAERWNIPGYLSTMTGKMVKHRTEYNTNSHFLYSAPTRRDRLRKRHRAKRLYDDGAGNEEEMEQLVDSQGRVAVAQRADLKPEALRMTFDEWLEKANRTHVDMEDEHYYFRLIGCGYMGTKGNCDQGSSEYLYDEMPYFQPHNDNRNELYLGNPWEQKGIHCRFGMKGVIAENHFDAGRNSIALLGGRRRYILSHPRQCENLALFPHGHESARHSEVDYANPDLERFPEFAHNALANEVVLEAGQVLYLPVFWFHYIVSLEINYQCNTRSGNTDHYNSFIHGCGFPIGGRRMK